MHARSPERYYSKFVEVALIVVLFVAVILTLAIPAVGGMPRWYGWNPRRQVRQRGGPAAPSAEQVNTRLSVNDTLHEASSSERHPPSA